MTELIFTIAVFIVAHMLPMIPALRTRLIAVIGKAPYMVGFSLMSLGLAGWLGVAYAQAPYIETWGSPVWARWLVLGLMAPASIMLVAVFTNPNPLSVALKSDGFDPARPGIVAITRHPLLAALVMWAGGHLLANGDVASHLLFGLLAALGLAGPVSVEKRKRQKMPGDEWERLARASSFIPLWAIARGRARFDIAGIGRGTILAGMVLYGLLLYLHPLVIGVDPLLW